MDRRLSHLQWVRARDMIVRFCAGQDIVENIEWSFEDDDLPHTTLLLYVMVVGWYVDEVVHSLGRLKTSK